MNHLRLAYPSVRETFLQNALDETRGDVPLALRLVRLRLQVGPSWPPQTGLDDENTRKRLHGSSPDDSTVDSLSKRRRVSLSLTQPPQDRNPPHDPSANVATGVTTSMVECACCFDDISISVATFCSNPSPHYFCFKCAIKNAEEEIGKAKFNLLCFDLSECKFPFSESEIRRSLDEKTFERFDQLRTDNELRQANLEGLVKCPFCPFAAIMEDPTDAIFECLRCFVRSCRHCLVQDHRPATCDQYQREKNIRPRVLVEEAMTDALLRKCNGCGLRFLKEDGCNKMTCPQCNNKQCFVCSENVGNYEHFSQKNGGKGCPMYGDMAELLQEEVAVAQKNTVRRIVQNRPDLKEDDLIVDKDATLERRQNPEGHVRPVTPRRAIIDPDDMGRLHDNIQIWWEDFPERIQRTPTPRPEVVLQLLNAPPPAEIWGIMDQFGRNRQTVQEHGLNIPNPPRPQPIPSIVNRHPPVYHQMNPLGGQIYPPQPPPPHAPGNLPPGRGNAQLIPLQPPPAPLPFPMPYAPYQMAPHIQHPRPANPNPPPPTFYQAPAPPPLPPYWHPQQQQQPQFPPYQPPPPYLYRPPPAQPQPYPPPLPLQFQNYQQQPPPQPPMHYPQYNTAQYLPPTGTMGTQTEPRPAQIQMQNAPEPQVGERRRLPWENFDLENAPFEKRPRLR